MEKQVIVVDDFEPDIDGVADAARAQDYSPMFYEGHEYSGMAGRGMYFPSALLAELMGFPVEPVETIFRCGVTGDKMTTWIHNDLGVIGAEWAAILYLTDPPENRSSGTAFWLHKSRRVNRQASVGAITQDEAAQLNKDGQSQHAWDMDGFVAMRKNRLAVYPVTRFHSRWPERAFGTSPADGRLIWVGFFRESK